MWGDERGWVRERRREGEGRKREALREGEGEREGASERPRGYPDRSIIWISAICRKPEVVVGVKRLYLDSTELQWWSTDIFLQHPRAWVQMPVPLKGLFPHSWTFLNKTH